MAIRAFLRKTGIRSRVFIAAILPVILMSILLGNYYIMNWKDEVYKRIDENGARYSVDMSKLCEFALFTHNIDFLEILSRSLFSDPDVYSVRILDADKKDIIYHVSPLYTSSRDGMDPPSTNKDLVFMAMVHPGQLTTIEGDEFYKTERFDTADQADLLGWIEVTMTDAHEKVLKEKIIVKMLMIIIAVLIATFTLAYSISARITRPILGMKENVAKLASGDILPPLTATSSDELGELEAAFHEMAVTVQNSKFELQKRVDIATARNLETISHLEKTNAELLKARELMFEANAAKSEFMAKMSHEIRTPLHSIIGYINLIKKTNDSARQSEYIRVIEGASQHLLLLINDILDLSSLDSRGMELAHDEFNLRECIEDVVLLLSPGAHEKGLDFIFLFDSDVPVYVVGDQYCLKQILINLLGNAVKFTREGEVVLHVSLDSNDIDSSVISMRICDTGIGIASDQIDLIQTPFYQIDNSRKRDHQGTGLGLAIVNKLLGILESKLTIESTPNTGSVFSFNIRLEKQQEKSGLTHVYANCFDDLKVLCYDSHPLMLRALRNQVLEWTTNVYAAPTIDKVIELTESADIDDRPFNLIIIGINQRKLGIEELDSRLGGHIKKLEHTALLFMVNETTPDICDDFGWLSKCACISKPVSQEFLRETIASLVDRPVNDEDKTMQAAENSHSPSTPLVTNDQDKPCILLAEDNNFNRLYVSTLLRENNFIVREATNGVEALHLARQQPFDLILMDIHLPEIDGITVAGRIGREAPSNQNTPILALTADIYIRNMPEYRRTGFAGLITKPIDEQEFWQQIRSHIKLVDDNTAAADSLTGLDKMKKTLLPQLLKELPEHAIRIKSAFDARSRERLSASLHELKGVAGYFKLATLKNTAAIVEAYINTDSPCNWDDLAPLIARLDEQIQLLIDQEFS